MYENHKLCETLRQNEICLVVEQYREGLFERKFHEHVRAHRLSADSLQHLLQSLVLKFENAIPETILRSYLNKRGKEPSAYSFMWNTSYPEPGVLRKYCGTNTKAWADQVVAPNKFRK